MKNNETEYLKVAVVKVTVDFLPYTYITGQLTTVNIAVAQSNFMQSVSVKVTTNSNS